MKRQKLRKTLLIISFILLPITLNYLSPIIILIGAYQGIITASFISLTSLFIISLLFGRIWCGWLCPAGGLQEICFLGKTKRANNKYAWVKFIVWIPLITAIVILFTMAGGVSSINPFLHIEQGFSLAELQNYIIYYGVVSLIIILAYTVARRGFCHFACFMAPFMIVGRKIRNFFNWPSLRLKSDKEGCISCKACTKNCPMSIDVESMVKRGSMENSECILCAQCIDICPKKVISYSFSSGK